LTWAIGSLSNRVLVNNGDADEVWELPQTGWADMEWNLFEIDAHRRADTGRFDRVFLTQIFPSRFANYDKAIKPALFRNYSRSITVAIDADGFACAKAEFDDPVPLTFRLVLTPTLDDICGKGQIPGCGTFAVGNVGSIRPACGSGSARTLLRPAVLGAQFNSGLSK
jgi:hypothetical protein